MQSCATSRRARCSTVRRPIDPARDLVSITKFSLRLLARRAIAGGAEVAELDALLSPLVADAGVARGHRAWHRHRVGAARRAGRQPRAPPQRGHLRPSLRRVAARCEQRQERAAPTLPRAAVPQANSALWRIVVTRKVCDRTRRLHRAADEGRAQQEGGVPMPQALHRTRSTTTYLANNSPLTLPRSGGRGQSSRPPDIAHVACADPCGANPADTTQDRPFRDTSTVGVTLRADTAALQRLAGKGAGRTALSSNCDRPRRGTRRSVVLVLVVAAGDFACVHHGTSTPPGGPS